VIGSARRQQLRVLSFSASMLGATGVTVAQDCAGLSRYCFPAAESAYGSCRRTTAGALPHTALGIAAPEMAICVLMT
jgi:hypothetical protein